MHIQQVRTVRKTVLGSDGRTYTEAVQEPVTDAELLSHAGRTYETKGNGVFNVPDEVGAQLLGGIFVQVGDGHAEARRAKVEMAAAHYAGQSHDAPAIEIAEAEAAELAALREAGEGLVEPPEPGTGAAGYVNAAAPIEGGTEATKAAEAAKKATRAKKATKANGSKKAAAKS